jgi:cytochrome c553
MQANYTHRLVAVLLAGNWFLLGCSSPRNPPPAPAAAAPTARAETPPPVALTLPPVPPMPPAPVRRRPAPVAAAATPAPAPVTATPAAATPLAPGDALAWDAVTKEQDTKPGQLSAEFFFAVTNISTSDVVIHHVQTSCGCTVAKLPSQPWVLKPQENGKINVTVDLRGKPVGTMFKTITAFFTNSTTKALTIKVTIPDSPEMARQRNQQMALQDRQKVFKDDCARCHAQPTQGKTGKELFAAACGICHEAEHRASMVPDLRAMNHSTDRIYWKQWIITGKPGTAMPGFSKEQGGPLTAEQIDSLADYLDGSIAHTPAPATTAQLVVPKPRPLSPAPASVAK